MCPIHCYLTTSQKLRISKGAGAGPLLDLYTDKKELVLFPPALSPAQIKYKEPVCLSLVEEGQLSTSPLNCNKRSHLRTKLPCRSYRSGQCYFLEAPGWLFLHLHGDWSGINWSSNVETSKTGPPEILLTGLRTECAQYRDLSRQMI